VEALARPERGQPPVTLFEMPVNAPSPYLSDQIDQSFTALRQRLLEEAGWDLLGRLDGMFEALEARPLPGQTAESWNKAGRAFDLYYRDALGLEPQVMVVREDVGPQTYWRIFVKTAVQDGSQGEPLTTINWDFQARSGDDPQYYEQGGKWGEGVPSGYFIDFTALAASYGWQRVPANQNWRTYFPDIRFWHFENQGNLTWEEAMRQLYSEAELSENP
jgi:TolB protein